MRAVPSTLAPAVADGETVSSAKAAICRELIEIRAWSSVVAQVVEGHLVALPVVALTQL